MLKLSRRTFMLGALAPAFPSLSWAQNDEIRVICSGGFTARVQHPRASVRADHGKEGRQRVWRVDG